MEITTTKKKTFQKKMSNKQINELIYHSIMDYVQNLLIIEHNQGIKMGRIPKAEKVKAIEVLRNSDQVLTDEDLVMLEEEDPETSYSKRFEKRRELDKNLKKLAENVLRSCTGGGTSDSPGNINAESDSSPKSDERKKRSSQGKSMKKQSSTASEHAELMSFINNLGEQESNADNRHVVTCLDSHEDYMNRFLNILFEKSEK